MVLIPFHVLLFCFVLMVQFKPTAEAKQQNFRFKLETHTCGGCQRAEYACTCEE